MIDIAYSYIDIFNWTFDYHIDIQIQHLSLRHANTSRHRHSDVSQVQTAHPRHDQNSGRSQLGWAFEI